MKKYFSAAICMIALGIFGSCEIDNYDGPDAHLEGKLIIAGTGNPQFDGQPFQAELGTGSGSIRMIETSWTASESVTPRDLNLMLDGTYRNTKLFSGTYTIYPYKGAFYPYDESEYKSLELKGKKTLDFEVTPFLNVEWVEKPTVFKQVVPGSNPEVEGYYIKAKAKFSINRKIKEDGTEIVPTVAYGRMLVGTNNRRSAVGDYSVDIAYTNEDEGTEIEFVTRRQMWYEHTRMYVCIGFKCKNDNPNGITDKFNYTTIVPVDIP